MYLHLSTDTVVRTRDIVGIFDLETCTISKSGRAFFAAAEKRGEVVTLSGDELPKSALLCRGSDGGTVVYLSHLATGTLRRRAANPFRMMGKK